MIWQTFSWQNMLKQSEQVEKSIHFSYKNTDIFIEKRQLRGGEYGLFLLGFDRKDIYDQELEKKLIDICKKEKGLFLQIETFSYENNIVLPITYFKKGFFKNFINSYTNVIDLSLSEDEILAKMKPKGRYNIRLATKKGVEVREVEKTSENIEIFANLISETAERDKFMVNSDVNYYSNFLKHIENSKLFLAYFEGKEVAGGIFTYTGNQALYYYGASSSDKKYRKYMAPYLLQWTAIQAGKENGQEIYDFLGVTSKDTGLSLAGVTDFKLKFSQDVREVSKNYIYVNKKLKYYFMLFLRKILKKIK